MEGRDRSFGCRLLELQVERDMTGGLVHPAREEWGRGVAVEAEGGGYEN